MNFWVLALIQGRNVFELFTSFLGAFSSRIFSRFTLRCCQIFSGCQNDHLVRRKDCVNSLTSCFSFVSLHLFQSLTSLFAFLWWQAFILLLMVTASWSATPSVMVGSSVSPGVLVKNRSRMLLILVGAVTSWASPRS